MTTYNKGKKKNLKFQNLDETLFKIGQIWAKMRSKEAHSLATKSYSFEMSS